MRKEAVGMEHASGMWKIQIEWMAALRKKKVLPGNSQIDGTNECSTSKHLQWK